MYLRRSISNIHNTSETAFLAEHCPELSVAVLATATVFSYLIVFMGILNDCIKKETYRNLSTPAEGRKVDTWMKAKFTGNGVSHILHHLRALFCNSSMVLDWKQTPPVCAYFLIST